MKNEQLENMVQKNIIWIVLDSIRGDRTPFGGHSRETMPTLKDAAAQSNAVGTTCISHGIWSQPSMASMMTGTWPSQHGTGLHNQVLPTEIPTVAERLSEADYHTIGLSTNPYFSPDSGLDRGFDEFDFLRITDLVKKAGVTSVASFIHQLRRYSAGITTEKRKHSPDYLFNKFVQNKLTKLADNNSPFALVAHYHGVHHPYYPAPKFQEIFSDDSGMTAADAAELAYQMTVDPYSTIANGDELSDLEWTAIRTVYDSLIRQVDSLMGRLLNHISEVGLGENTILVITADHGDLLGERNLVSHKLLLHDALIEVPLFVRGSERLQSLDEGLIQHIDVMQTILDEIGAPTDGMHGITIPEKSREFTITQRGPETAEKTLNYIRERNPAFAYDYVGEGLLTALRTGDWKLVKGEENIELFRLPNEIEDVSSNHPEYSAELSQTLDDWMDQYGTAINTDDSIEFSEDVQEHLSDLGYLVD